MEWIFKRNELEYVATGTGDKWGMTWNGGLKKQLNKIGLTDMSQATQQQLNEIYDNIATSASKTFGENKIALGVSFRDFFKNKISADEYKELEKLLLKYRM